MLELSARLPGAAEYFSLAKILFFLLLPLPWLAAAPWVHHDGRQVHANRTLWDLLVLGLGTAALVLWLRLPLYFMGLLIFVLLAGSVLIAYVSYRNRRVEDPELKVLTREHFRRLLSRPKAKTKPVQRLKLYDAYGHAVPVPDVESAEEQEILTYNALQDLLYNVLWRRASRAEIAPAGGKMHVRFTIDGVPARQEPMDLELGQEVIQRAKKLSGTDPEELRRPQRGKLVVDMANNPVDIQLTTAGTSQGQGAQLRVVQESVRQNIDSIGLDEQMREKLLSLAQAPGLVICSAPQGNGLTSTLYSLLKKQDAFTQHLITLEKQPEADLENITQVEYATAEELAEKLASNIRRDPNVILVDQCPDEKTASLLLEAAEDKLVLLGVRATDSFRALAHWVKCCGDARRAVGPLRAVTCQFLVRMLCQRCREPYQPDPKLLAKVNLDAGETGQFHRPPSEQVVDRKGNPILCAGCQGTGYVDRTGVFELLEIDERLREKIAGGASLSEIKAAARKAGMLNLQERALQKVVAGQTSVQEVVRVTQSQQGNAPAARKRSPSKDTPQAQPPQEQ